MLTYADVCRCELAAERSCATALLCSASAVIELQSCRIGGRGPLKAKEGSERAREGGRPEGGRPEGERGNGALARHAVRLQGRAHATLRHCQLQVRIYFPSQNMLEFFFCPPFL